MAQQWSRRSAIGRASGFSALGVALFSTGAWGQSPLAATSAASDAFPMLGQLDVVKAFLAARPGIQKALGPHGPTLMWHAKQGGADAAAVVQYLTTVGDADIQPATLPLAIPDRDALVGKYTYGSGPRDYFTVDVRTDMLKREQLVIAPKSPSRGKARRLPN